MADPTERNKLIANPLYAGLTRPITKAGITVEALVGCVVLTGGVHAWNGGNPLFLLSFGIFYSFCLIVERNEPWRFRLLWLWIRGVGRSTLPMMFYWRGISRSPFPPRDH